MIATDAKRWFRNVTCGALFATLSALMPAPAAAQTAGVEIGGLADVYYDWYSTKPTGNAPLRNFDTKHNQFSFTMVELWTSKTPTADSRTGFNVKLNFGPATTEFIHSTDPGGVGILQNVQQAYVSYLVPAGKGLQVDVGEFVTHNGSEVIEAKDDWNYSRSLLFAWAIPYYHAGVRITYPASDKVTLAGGVVNGWNNLGENNTGKTVWGQIILKPSSAFTFIQNYTGGPEQAGNNSDWRHLSDTQAIFTVSPMLSLMGNYDYGSDKVGGTGVHWQGVAGYVKFQPTKVVAIIPRAEYYDDADGFTTGVAQKAKEFTLTLELKPADTFMWRIEYRSDFSDVAFFRKDNGAFKKNQHSIGFGLLYNFSKQ